MGDRAVSTDWSLFGELTQALGQLRTVVENYPQLQSQARFADLMTSLESSENRIDVARTRYNDAVRDYNTEIRTFPSSIGANVIHTMRGLGYKLDEGAADTDADAAH